MRLSMISPLRLKYFRSRETSRVIKVHHNSAPSAMEIIPTISETLPSASGVTTVNTFPSRFCKHDFDIVVIQVLINRSGSIAPSANTRNKTIGKIAPFFLQKLPFNLFADNRLKSGYHIGIRMRTNGRSNHIMRVFGMTAPVANGLVCGVFQCHVSRSDRNYRGPQHSHFFHVRKLPFHIGFPHINRTRHLHEGTHRSRGYSMLSGTGFGNDAGFAHSLGNEHLPYGIVDFVGTGMVKVFAFKINLTTMSFRKLF
jgi:hypothetical protein